MAPRVRSAVNNQDLHYFKGHRTPVCLIAGEMAGSRMSKVRVRMHIILVCLANF